MSAQVNIPDEVLSILKRSRVEGDKLYLPREQLERGLYEQVNKALSKLGGKWKGGKVRAHVFDRDVSEVIQTAVGVGSFIDEKKEFQFFETPRAVAERMIELADLRPGQMILEPSAGMGKLAHIIQQQMPEGCSLCVCEVNPFMRLRLESAGFRVAAFPGFDFLRYEPHGAQYVFDRIIQNPPFSKGQDAEHLIHAFYCLAPGGRLVSVMSAGITFRQDTAYRETASVVRDFGGSIEELPAGSFKESGTNTRAVIVTLNK